MTAAHRILVVEDDPEIGALVADYLRRNDLDADIVASAAAMRENIQSAPPDLIVLDINLPDEDGLAACRRLRMNSDLPVIMLTARGEDIDRIIGLEMGADDYLAKPFNPRELLARIRSVLRRRTAPAASPASVVRFVFDKWSLDLIARRLLAPSGAQVPVTGAEFELLHAFCDRAGQALSRDQLLDLTHGRTGGPFERSIDVLVSRLRQKIESDPKNPRMIVTVRSEGYRFEPAVARES